MRFNQSDIFRQDSIIAARSGSFQPSDSTLCVQTLMTSKSSIATLPLPLFLEYILSIK